MDFSTITACTAFDDGRCIARGALRDVARVLGDHLDHAPDATLLVFDDATGRVLDLDLRGSADAILARLPETGPTAKPSEKPRGPGRPRLGVVSKEVTLLPRHWQWLGAQPGGASVMLRKLVDKARRDADGPDRRRRSQEAAYRFMGALAGDLPGFEEATRALFAGDARAFDEHVRAWPGDIADHARRLAGAALAPPGKSAS